jgi:hypothetical protein
MTEENITLAAKIFPTENIKHEPMHKKITLARIP